MVYEITTFGVESVCTLSFSSLKCIFYSSAKSIIPDDAISDNKIKGGVR